MGQQFNMRNYTVKDGVAQSQVYALLQDSRGYLWMGTRGGGLTRFDGLNFKTFSQKEGLANNYIYKIKEDSNADLWIGTANGLAFYNGNRFKHFYPLNAETPVFIQDIDIVSPSEIWLASSIGILLFDGKSFRNISEELGRSKEIVNAVFVSKSSVYVGTGKGLFALKRNQQGFSIRDLGEKSRYMRNAITCIKEDKTGKLWIGTYGDGVYVKQNNSFSRIDLKQELYKQTILDIYFDHQGNCWFATLQKGVCMYAQSEKSFQFIAEAEGLSNNHVRSICQDNALNFWFGTSGGGVCHYFGKQFTHYDQKNGLAGNFIYSVHKDYFGNLWIGNSDQGVSMLKDKKFTNYNATNGFLSTKIKTIISDSSGKVYFGTEGKGVYVFDGENFTSLRGINSHYVRALAFDKGGDLWIATAGHGLLKYSKINGKENVLMFTVADGMLENRLTSLHIDKRGRIWYGTENNGLGYVLNDVPSKQFVRKKNGLPSNLIRSLTEDQQGNLFVGTAGSGVGFFSLYTNNKNIKSFTLADGLRSLNVYLLTIDVKNNLIIGSETGLDYVYLNENRNIQQIKHYGRGDGFLGIETCQNAVCKDNDGTIWFGTIQGLSHFNPQHLLKNDFEPITRITDVKLFYIPIHKTAYKSAIETWNTVQKLNLPHDQNHLSFDFFAVNFSNPEGVKYQWKLEGFDENWSPINTEKSIVYSNLNPGKYTFLVRASNEDGVWNKIPTKLEIEIETPFWRTWWFILSSVLLTLLILVMLVRWRIKRIQLKAIEVQQKIQLEKEVLELEQKALRLQMNPHFIFNALNSIQSLIGSGNEQQARYFLAKFSRLMRQILANSRTTTITLEEEISTLENYLLIEKFCTGDRFDYSISCSDQLEKDYIQIPPMLIQPFVENAIKHGFKSHPSQVSDFRGNIKITFEEDENQLLCTIQDNGIGRKKAAELNQQSKETYHESTAMKVIEERLAIVNQDSNQLEIKDLVDAENKCIGTQVKLKIPIIN
jgi:ligand-binding sensor domain-containing protein/anti-sigma regulatory factor (Ser/Thr protein kinase)